MIVEAGAVRKLVAHMHSSGADAVGGCVFVSNAKETWLTRMQAVKYWIGYQFLKNLENAFDHVMCLSGCLTLYKRQASSNIAPSSAMKSSMARTASSRASWSRPDFAPVCASTPAATPRRRPIFRAT